MRNERARIRAAGFSLIELLVVILIITVIISIVVPVLGHVRTAAKVQGTRDQMDSVSQAISSFELSERRPPGQYTPTEMGTPGASAQFAGLSQMQNIILELAPGWNVQTGGVQVNPTDVASKAIRVDPGRIGTAKGYFTPNGKFMKKQDGTDSPGTKADASGSQLTNGVQDIPELVDYFGTPILAWAQDPLARQPVVAATDFARDTSGSPGNATLSRFYWQQNQCILASPAAGVQRKDMVNQSVIGAANTGASRDVSMTGFLGNPSAPIDVTRPLDQIFPSSSRGSVVLHSAGADAIYLGKANRGGALAVSAGSANKPALKYGLNFMDLAGQPLRDSNGKPTTADLLTQFDDIVISTGAGSQ